MKLKKLKEDSIKDLDLFKDEMSRKSEMEAKAAAAAAKRAQVEIENQVKTLGKNLGKPDAKGKRAAAESKSSKQAPGDGGGAGGGRGRGGPRDGSVGRGGMGRGRGRGGGPRPEAGEQPPRDANVSQQDSSPTPDGSVQAPITAAQTHTSLGDGPGTVGASLDAGGAAAGDGPGPAKPDGAKTERQTKTDFDSTQRKRVPVTVRKAGPGSALEGSPAPTDKMTVHDPSHLKDAEERHQKLKEEVDKHKRELEELEKKLMQSVLQHTRFEEHVEKELARLGAGPDDAARLAVPGATRTASSFRSRGPSINQIITNSDVPGASRGSNRAGIKIGQLQSSQSKRSRAVASRVATRAKSNEADAPAGVERPQPVAQPPPAEVEKPKEAEEAKVEPGE